MIFHELLLTGWARDLIGYFAAALVFATFSMVSMFRLRIVAIISNFAFIYYASLAAVYPLLILHCCLLPMNITRLGQIIRARAAGKRLLTKTAGSQTDLSKPVYLSPAALAEPATALDLAEREQARLASHLAARLPGTQASNAVTSNAVTGSAAAVLLDAIDEFLAALAAAGGLSASQTAHLTGLQSRDEVLRGLHETLGDLANSLDNPDAPLPDWLTSALREGLGTILLIAEHAAAHAKLEDISLLLSMTSDRSAQVETIRGRVVASSMQGGEVNHRAVYKCTALYERSVWLLQRYARLLEAVAAQAASAPAGAAA
jgi:hypothetical protein